jgi:hypothetical protein
MDTTTMRQILTPTGRNMGLPREQRRFYRSADLEPPVEDIVGLVRHALMEGEHNLYTSF